MHKRAILIFITGTLMLAGLMSGVYASSIEQALSMPQTIHPTTTTSSIFHLPTPTRSPQTNGEHTHMSSIIPERQVIALDAFQRQDQTLWGTTSDGHQWEGDANAQYAFSINNSTGKMSGGQGSLNAIIGLLQQNVTITISGSVNQFGNDVNLGITLRWQDPNNWYKAFIDGTHLTILKDVNGQLSTIKQIDITIPDGVTHLLTFRALGSMLFAKVWSIGTPEPLNWLLTADDHTFGTGQFGIHAFEHTNTVITITSFVAIISSIDGST
jgi:hypothetical protein